MSEPAPFDPARHALFLDFDGTLAPLVDDPGAVPVTPVLVSRLAEIARETNGALAIVSGRRIADLDRFLAPLHFAAAGVHGLERRARPGDPVASIASPEDLDDVRMRLRDGVATEPRLMLEDKGTALVLHYRTAPDLAEAAARLMAEAVTDREKLSVLHGDMIVEVHPAGMDKGVAVAAFMAEAPFAGRVPVYLGDDRTDEFALGVVEEQGGLAVKVGRHPSVARHRLADVAAVHRWLGVAEAFR